MLTNEQLKISPKELAGLIHIRDVFANPAKAPPLVITDEHENNGFSYAATFNPGQADGALGFTMRFGGVVNRDEDKRFNCGSAACIGGHLKLHLDGYDIEGDRFPNGALADANLYVMRRDPVTDKGKKHGPIAHLFFPYEIDGYWHLIQAKHAAEAITNFIEEGDAKWLQVMKEEIEKVSTDN